MFAYRAFAGGRGSLSLFDKQVRMLNKLAHKKNAVEVAVRPPDTHEEPAKHPYHQYAGGGALRHARHLIGKREEKERRRNKVIDEVEVPAVEGAYFFIAGDLAVAHIEQEVEVYEQEAEPKVTGCDKIGAGNTRKKHRSGDIVGGKRRLNQQIREIYGRPPLEIRVAGKVFVLHFRP